MEDGSKLTTAVGGNVTNMNLHIKCTQVEAHAQTLLKGNLISQL